jgi:hypothetical protein
MRGENGVTGGGCVRSAANCRLATTATLPHISKFIFGLFTCCAAFPFFCFPCSPPSVTSLSCLFRRSSSTLPPALSRCDPRSKLSLSRCPPPSSNAAGQSLIERLPPPTTQPPDHRLLHCPCSPPRKRQRYPSL